MIFLDYDMSVGQERDRNKIEEKYKWNLTEIYPTDEVWKDQKEKISKQIPEIANFKGKLNSSPKVLRQCLDLAFTLQKELNRLYVYASMLSDQDTRVSKYQAMEQEMSQVYSNFSASSSFIEPEILNMDQSTIDDFIKKDNGLEVYQFYLNDIQRRKAHTGTEGEEKIIADASLMADNAQSVYGIFTNSDFPHADITLSDGKTVKLDRTNFTLIRASANRDDRKKAFEIFFNKYNEFRRTFGTQLYGDIKKNMFYTRARKYSSALENSLNANNIPVEVYHSLINSVNNNLETFHRYLNLRKRILGVEELHYYDLYAPLLKDVDLKYSVEQAQKHVLTSLSPLGKDYISVIDKAFKEQWIDMYPNEGKRTGAYSNGAAYDVHPYILMNYNGKYDDMGTLTHELGHTMQSYLSNKAQPYPLASYPIFVAEVASTFNEALLHHYMLNNIKDDATRLSILGNYLENVKGTLFRQTQFAEFELKIHELAEKGEALTGDRFNEIYEEITKKYYGHGKGICIVDDEIKVEWAMVPHFYYNFYMYQYSTSFTASQALSEKVIAGDKDATKRFLTFLSSGGSQYPIDLLKEAGVDMTTAQPFELTIKKMNRVMDEMEQILNRMKKS